MAKVKKYNKCIICANPITGVEKIYSGLIFCPKCFRVLVKEEKRQKEEKEKNWYNPNWTESEYYHYVFDHFC